MTETPPIAALLTEDQIADACDALMRSGCEIERDGANVNIYPPSARWYRVPEQEIELFLDPDVNINRWDAGESGL